MAPQQLFFMDLARPARACPACGVELRDQAQHCRDCGAFGCTTCDRWTRGYDGVQCDGCLGRALRIRAPEEKRSRRRR